MQSKLVMRHLAVGVIVMLLRLGLADASPDRRPRLSARVGWNSTAFANQDDPGEHEPDGGGLLIDVSVAWRLQPWISVALYGAYSSIHDDYVHEYMGSHEEDDRFLELGPRVSMHLFGVFAGLGAAMTRIHSRYTMSYQVPGHQLPDSSHTESATTLELHLGYTTPRIAALRGIALQVLFMTSTTRNAQDGAFHSRRIAVGFEY